MLVSTQVGLHVEFFRRAEDVATGPLALTTCNGSVLLLCEANASSALTFKD